MQAEADIALLEPDPPADAGPPLSLATTDALMLELSKRFGNVALIGATYNANGGQESYGFRWAGNNRHTVMGLCDDLKARVLSDLQALQRMAEAPPPVDAE